MMQTKDGKWKPAKVTGISQSAPCSYFITTPQGQCYRRNRIHLRKMTGQNGDDTIIDDYLDDEMYENETEEASQNIQINPSQPTPMTVPLRQSRRTIKKPL